MVASDPDGDINGASTDQYLFQKQDYQQVSTKKGSFVKKVNVHKFQMNSAGVGRGGYFKITEAPAKSPLTLMRMPGNLFAGGNKMFSLLVDYYVSFRDMGVP